MNALRKKKTVAAPMETDLPDSDTADVENAETELFDLDALTEDDAEAAKVRTGKKHYLVSTQRRELIELAKEKKERQRRISFIAGVVVGITILGISITASFFIFGPSVDREKTIWPTEELKLKTQEAVLELLDNPETASWPVRRHWRLSMDDYYYTASSHVTYTDAAGNQTTSTFLLRWDTALREICYFQFDEQILRDELVIPPGEPAEVPLNESGVADPAYL